MRTAVIGIGSNSLRMLVADISDGRLNRLRRYREGLRVFAALDEHGDIKPEMVRKACESVRSFQSEALLKGAEQVHLFATSAVRDAHNQQDFARALEASTGMKMEICSGDLEALLSFVGATSGERTGMIDIGGGSTEIVIGGGRRIDASVSLQMGAVRLCRMLPISSTEDAWRTVEAAAAVPAPHRAQFLRQGAESWVGVGGTFTTTAALVQRIPWDQRERIHGFALSKGDVRLAIEHLAPMPMEKRLSLPYLQPQRADIVVHGIAILLACMNGLDIAQITVSEYGNLEGYLKMKYLNK